jgi:aryl-alcohol dehydrogenase-like predicted oxidoreductase
MTQWAMGWCLRNLIVSSVICGCKNPGQVSSNADAAGLVAE